MKITKSQLEKVIREEVRFTLSENWSDMLSATRDMERSRTEAEVVSKIEDYMSSESADPRAFVNWVQEYHPPDDWTSEDTEFTKRLLAKSTNLSKEMKKYVRNVFKFGETQGEKGHQYTEEPWSRSYMKTLDAWIDSEGLENHLAAVMAEYLQDVLLGDDMIKKGYVDVYDPGL